MDFVLLLNRLRFRDGQILSGSSVARCLSVPRICSCGDRKRSLWGSPGAGADVAPSPKKTACGICGRGHRSFYDQKLCVVRDLSCGAHRIYLQVLVRRVACRSCGKVKRERLTWLADNPFCIKGFAWLVGADAGLRRSRMSPASSGCIGKRLRSWKSNTCANNCAGSARRHPK